MSCNRALLWAVACLIFLNLRSGADDKIWSAVILASNPKGGERPKPTPDDLLPFEKKLAKVFGYRQFEILGSAKKVMDEKTEQWLVPTRNFWASAKATQEATDYLLELQFFHDERLILTAKAKLGSQSPLFVRGPEHARGQLIMVFEIRP